MDTIGTYLRRARQARGMSLGELARATRIPTASIERIEADHFDDLPGEVFTRGFLKSYAAAVGLNPDEVLARYTANRRSVSIEPLPVAAPIAKAGRRRFGVAIAFVLLLLLFTLALSIVMRPRGYDRPQELSQASEGAGAVVLQAVPIDFASVG